jgi:Mn2+/Fe2+ NRAMP family transporter
LAQTIEPLDPPQPAPASHVSLIEEPPQTAREIIRRLGPGLIIAASIVGSGELIATTKTGAEAGFWLLWLILLGCVVKVFVQIEFGRFSIAQGKTSLRAMNLVPGPRLRVNWLVWYWVLMFTAGIGQLGGIVGSVGQSLALAIPLTGDVQQLMEVQDQRARFDYDVESRLRAAEADNRSTDRQAIEAEVVHERGPRPEIPENLRYTYDDIYWCVLLTAVTVVLLVNGRYSLVQSVSTILVAGFTAVTCFNLFALQTYPEWTIGWKDIAQGFSFSLPPSTSKGSPLFTALATFGIIGVGASELVSYPYWCLEKGYARFTGPRTSDASWGRRAQGWLRVMRWDAYCSMVIYTFATMAFYLLGAAVLSRAGLIPEGNQLIFTLTQMYVPVFGEWAAPVFLLGAIAVLYSTFFVASAGNARMAADCLGIFRIAAGTERSHQLWLRIFCALFPCLSVAIYVWSKDPVLLVMIGGLLQTLMLPMLAGAALYFRFYYCDERIRPSRLWDACLWLSSLCLLVVGLFGAWTFINKSLVMLD